MRLRLIASAVGFRVPLIAGKKAAISWNGKRRFRRLWNPFSGIHPGV
jgi:hypothetical protein